MFFVVNRGRRNIYLYFVYSRHRSMLRFHQQQRVVCLWLVLRRCVSQVLSSPTFLQSSRQTRVEQRLVCFLFPPSSDTWFLHRVLCWLWRILRPGLRRNLRFFSITNAGRYLSEWSSGKMVRSLTPLLYEFPSKNVAAFGKVLLS